MTEAKDGDTVRVHYTGKLDDGFVFDTEFLAQAVFFGFKIGDVPVPVRYFDEASSINFSNSLVYGTRTLFTLVKFLLQSLNLTSYKLFSQNK